MITPEEIRLLIRDFQDETGNSVVCANSPVETYRSALPDLCKYLAERLSVLARAEVQAERERCAAIADTYRLAEDDVGRLDGRGDDAESIAMEIRAGDKL